MAWRWSEQVRFEFICPLSLVFLSCLKKPLLQLPSLCLSCVQELSLKCVEPG